MALVQSVVPVGELDPRTCRPRIPAMAGNGIDPAANRAPPGLKVKMGTLAARLPEERVATRCKPGTARDCLPLDSTIHRTTILHTRGDEP